MHTSNEKWAINYKKDGQISKENSLKNKMVSKFRASHTALTQRHISLNVNFNHKNKGKNDVFLLQI